MWFHDNEEESTAIGDIYSIKIGKLSRNAR
jgi:hypothetical protein